MRWEADRPRFEDNVWMEVQILGPSCSSYRYHPCPYRTLQEQQLYSYYIQTVQMLVPHDTSARCTFCQRVLQQLAENPTFTVKVSFTDELCFTRTGITNIHNEHVWSDKNSHAIRSHNQKQYVFSNMCAEILGDCFISPHILPAKRCWQRLP
jgi:hypothetical protein